MADEATAKTDKGNGGTDNAGLIARLGAKWRQAQQDLKTHRTRADVAEAQLKTVTAERDSLKVPGKAAEELTKLKGELRAVKHRTAFDRAARAAKVPDAHLDDLWELSKLDTSADAPDDAAITKVLDEQKTKRPIYFADAQSTSSITAETVEAAAKPAPGSGRGQPLPAGQQAFFQVRSKDLNDPKWRIANDAKLHKAFEDGNVRIIAD